MSMNDQITSEVILAPNIDLLVLTELIRNDLSVISGKHTILTYRMGFTGCTLVQRDVTLK